MSECMCGSNHPAGTPHYEAPASGTMSDYETAVAKAAEIGREHGENAIAGWFDSVVCYMPRLLIDQLDGGGSWADGNGGPDTNPTLPAPDLSGEWADGYTPMLLASDCGIRIGVDPYGLWVDALCDAYESAFSDAVETAVRAACENTLSE